MVRKRGCVYVHVHTECDVHVHREMQEIVARWRFWQALVVSIVVREMELVSEGRDKKTKREITKNKLASRQ